MRPLGKIFLVDDSRVNSAYSLALVKGSHLFVNRVLANPLVIQVPEDGRIVFALLYKDETLIGTTELKHEIAGQIMRSDQELDYLLNTVSSVLDKEIESGEVTATYAGVRPIVSTKQSINALSKATREAAIETVDNLTNVFGGKWTSAMRLGKMVSDRIVN